MYPLSFETIDIDNLIGSPAVVRTRVSLRYYIGDIVNYTETRVWIADEPWFTLILESGCIPDPTLVRGYIVISCFLVR